MVEAPGNLWGASDCEQRSAVGVGGMSVFANSAHVSLVVVLLGVAVVSGFVLTECIQDGDVKGAWLWLGLFMVACLGGTWGFWRLV